MSSSRVSTGGGGGGGQSPARAQSSICLLWLLFCKTVKFQLANTLTSVIIILGPIIVFFMFSATAAFKNPEHDPEKIYPSVNISSNVPNIYYSPKNRIVDDIIDHVVREVGAMDSKGYFTANELEEALIEDSAFVGIEFDDEFYRIKELPTKVSVAVRFPTHVRCLPKLRWDGRVFYKRLYLGTDYYLIEGFLIIQAKLSEALIRAKNEIAKLPIVDFKYLPEPKRMENTFKESRVALSGFLFLPFAISAAYLAQLIVEEKKMWGMMRMMRVRRWVHWTSWFLVAFLLFFIPTIVLVGLLKWRFYPMSDTSLVLVFFCVYIIEVVTSALLIAAIFSDTIGVQVTILFLHLFSWLPWRLMVMGYQANVRTIIACLFLNSSLAMGMEEFIEHENLFMGMRWNRVFSKTDPNDTLSLGLIMVIMLLGSVLRFLILWYVEELKGMKARKWYFPCQFKFWCPQMCRRRRQRDIDIENQDTEGEQEYEHEPLTHKNRAVIVRARHLEKNYNGQKVIRDLSLNFYEDEICVFLGHNDSGKSTTFRMLAGIEEPSSGQITISGFDLATEKGKALRSMSMCPQKSMFFDKLKVRWHMRFFCRLNGMNRKEASAEADKYLEIAQMQEFAKYKVNDLSSGFQRMLALCCSLCGHSKVVILDEPGTSMDPSLRRKMWDLLRKERKGRCIIMSTHNMLEAEVVADRVAVLCNGQVIGYGTPGFLTQIADSGASYFLICTKRDSCWVTAVTRFLQSRFPDVELDNEYGIYIIYKLPAKNIEQYSKLFQELEEALDDLMIKEFSVRAPTLGDVFLRIGAEMGMARDTTPVSIEDQALASPMSSLINLLPSFEVREDDTRVVCCNRWRAIMERKRLFLCRHRRFFLIIILLPVIMGVVLVIFEIVFFWLYKSLNALKITDLSSFSAVVMLESSENDSMALKYTNTAVGHGLEVDNTEGAPLGEYFVKIVEKDEMKYIRKVVAGATIDTDNDGIVAWANKKLEHGSALTLGLVYESLAWGLAELEIEIVNKPHAGAFRDAMSRLIRVTCMDFTIVVLLYLVVGTAIFAVMPVMERQTSLQHQQMCTGMSRITYWLSHLLWDYGVFLTMTPTMILIVGVAHDTAGPITILLLSFGFAVISFTYLMCLLSNNLGQMFSIMMYVNMIGVLSLFIHPKNEEDRYRIFEVVLMVHPHYALFNGVQDIIKLREILNVYHGEARARSPSMVSIEPEIGYDFKSIRYLIISGIVYLMLVLLSWIPRHINYYFKACKTKKILPTLSDEDIEVDRIRQRLDFITTKNYSSFPVIMKDVTKRYGDVLAVRALTLDINPFECVCLMGRNGAGKSSTFYMLVGKISITSGTIHIKGFSLKTRSKQGLKHVGFCPHEDTLAPYMTGWETLRFFCMINGIRRSQVRTVVQSLHECFRLGVHMDKRVSTYSNGTKRKLMIAVAALAPTLLCLDEPTAGVDMYAKYEIWKILESLRLGGRAILLTTHSMEECEMLGTNLGILDRGTLLCYGSLARLRDRFDKGIFVKIKVGTISELNILRAEAVQVSNSTGSSVALDSVSFGGTVASLKLSIMRFRWDMKDDSQSTSSESETRENYELLLQDVEEVFLRDHPYSSISEKYVFRGMITFVIPKHNISWSDIFSYMMGLNRSLQIMYYSISHTTLEDVFLDFIRRHNE